MGPIALLLLLAASKMSDLWGGLSCVQMILFQQVINCNNTNMLARVYTVEGPRQIPFPPFRKKIKIVFSVGFSLLLSNRVKSCLRPTHSKVTRRSLNSNFCKFCSCCCCCFWCCSRGRFWCCLLITQHCFIARMTSKLLAARHHLYTPRQSHTATGLKFRR